MVKQVSDSVADVDCAVLVTDPFGEIVESERQLIENIKELHLPAILVINKIDVLPYFSFDLNRVHNDYKAINPKAPLLTASTTTQQGIEELVNHLKERIETLLHDPS